MAADPKYQRAEDGSHRDFPEEHWAEGSENDGSAGREFDVPANAVCAQIFSSVAAFCGPVAEASLDISGDGFNACGIPAGGYSPCFSVKGKSKVSVKAVTGNLAVVTILWGGKQA